MIKTAFRRLVRRPGFSVVVIALLAGAVGINATVFAVLNAVAFRRLPYPNVDRLVDIRLAERCEYCQRLTVPRPIADEWQRSVPSVERWGLIHSAPGLVLTETRRELVGEAVTPAALDVLGIPMEAGRAFVAEDDVPGTAPRVILGGEFWRRQFAGDRAIVGRYIDISGRRFAIVGVARRSFAWPGANGPPDVWLTPSSIDDAPEKTRVAIIARLAPGATLARLNAELAQTGTPLIAQLLGSQELRTSAVPLSRVVAFSSGLELAVLQLLALVVLAVGCANVAGLLLARQQAERHLIGMRVVLGARARDLLVLPLLDVVPLVIVGTGLGLLAAARAAPFAGAYLGASSALSATVHVDAAVVAGTLLAVVVAAVLIAFVPARELFRAELRSWVQVSSQATAGSRQSRARQQILVGAQIGISTTLLVIAGVLVLNYARLAPSSGRTERYGSMSAEFGGAQYRDLDVAMFAATAQLAKVPGIVSVSFAAYSPMRTAMALSVDGLEAPVYAGTTPPSEIRIGPRVSRVAGTPIVAGRDFSADEIASRADGVVTVNEAMATRIWRGNAVGKRLRVAPGEPWRQVIGVTKNAVSYSGRVAADPARTAPMYAIPGLPTAATSARLSVLTDHDAEPLVGAVMARWTRWRRSTSS